MPSRIVKLQGYYCAECARFEKLKDSKHSHIKKIQDTSKLAQKCFAELCWNRVSCQVLTTRPAVSA